MQESGSQNLLTLYSDVRATPVRWLWYPYIAVGKITLLQGDPGDGKSTMILNLISEISKAPRMTPRIRSSPGWKAAVRIAAMWHSLMRKLIMA